MNPSKGGGAQTSDLGNSSQQLTKDPNNIIRPNLHNIIGVQMKKIGFTLAEVLITLGIIGIVAAMTLPVLMSSYKKHVIKTKLMKFYSVMNQAVQMSEVENGDKFYWDFNNLQTRMFWDRYLAKYVKVIKSADMLDENGSPMVIAYFADGSRVDIRANGRDYLFYVNSKKTEDAVRGVDVFAFVFYPNASIGYTERLKYTYKKGVEPYAWEWDGERESLFNNSVYGCNSTSGTNNLYCTKLIQLNNWKIPNDYPKKI